jgi:hypothetical protein
LSFPERSAPPRFAITLALLAAACADPASSSPDGPRVDAGTPPADASASLSADAGGDPTGPTLQARSRDSTPPDDVVVLKSTPDAPVDAPPDSPGTPVPDSEIVPPCSGAGCQTCPAGLHRCGDRCVRDTDPANCGSACVPCSNPMNGRGTCDGQKCGIECDVDYHPCNDFCASNFSIDSCGRSCTPCPAVRMGYPKCWRGLQCGSSCVDPFAPKTDAGPMRCPDIMDP